MLPLHLDLGLSSSVSRQPKVHVVWRIDVYERKEQLAEGAKLDAQIRRNLKELGYGR